MAEAFYESLLNSEIVGELQSYANQADNYVPVSQEYMGHQYHSVDVHPIPYAHPIERHIVRSMLTINKKYYNYDLYGTFEIQLLRYTPGGQYKWHCDYGLSANPDGDRKLSMSIQLSDAWDYNGGELHILDWQNLQSTMSKEVGSVLVFDSRVAHKVEPITEGERYAIVAWAHGPQLR